MCEPTKKPQGISITEVMSFPLRQSRGDSRSPIVNQIIGLPLALTVFPQVIEFTGEAVLELVEPGLYRKSRRDQPAP